MISVKSCLFFQSSNFKNVSRTPLAVAGVTSSSLLTSLELTLGLEYNSSIYFLPFADFLPILVNLFSISFFEFNNFVKCLYAIL